jgi:hypothetical protein
MANVRIADKLEVGPSGHRLVLHFFALQVQIKMFSPSPGNFDWLLLRLNGIDWAEVGDESSFGFWEK